MKLWTTYAWKDNEEGSFDYLMQGKGYLMI